MREVASVVAAVSERKKLRSEPFDDPLMAA